jgi:hypothetical protein
MAAAHISMGKSFFSKNFQKESARQSEIHLYSRAGGDRFPVEQGGIPLRHGLHKAQGFFVAAVTESVADFRIAHNSSRIDGEHDDDRSFHVAHSCCLGVIQILRKIMSELFGSIGENRPLHFGATAFRRRLSVQLLEQKAEKQCDRSHDRKLILILFDATNLPLAAALR